VSADVDRSDPVLMRAMLANWECLAREICRRFDGVVVEDARGFRFRSGLHSGFLNGVLRTSVLPDEVPALAREVRAWFPADLPWRWIVDHAELGTTILFRLEAEGFERRWPEMPGMALDLRGYEPRFWTPLAGRVTEVLDATDLEAWLSVRRVNLSLDEPTIAAWRRLHGEWGLGPTSTLRHFVGWDGDRPVAGASLYLDPLTGTAGIYHVDVLADARGRGYGKAVTTAALAAAREQDATLGVLSASTLGTPVYVRLGFAVVGLVTTFVGAAH
jgi:GNAT superfamily N-acetyltransferase